MSADNAETKPANVCDVWGCDNELGEGDGGICGACAWWTKVEIYDERGREWRS